MLRLLNIQGILGIGASLILGLLLVSAKMEARHWHKQSTQYGALYNAEKLAHVQTKLNYIDAAEKARQADLANVKRVKTEQAAISKDTINDLQTRLDDARARYDKLQRENGKASANPSGPGKPPVSSVPVATGGTPEASLEDQLLATEQAIQLDELIKWVKKQHEVQVSK